MYTSKGFRSSRRGYSARRRPRRSALVYGLLLVLALLLIGTLVTILDNGRVAVREQTITVSNLPPELEGFTILHISDLSGVRIGPQQRAVRQALSGKSYQAVCITGDMLGPDANPYPFFELISALDPSKPVFFIAGDGDPNPFPEDGTYSAGVLADYITGAQARGARYLDGTASMQYRGHTLWFSPAQQLTQDPAETEASLYSELARLTAAPQTTETLRAKQAIEYRIEALAKEKTAREQIQADEVHIVLSHRPLDSSVASIVQALAAQSTPFYRSISFILAGHYAGGQWRLPFVGALYARPYGFFPKEIEGIVIAGAYTQYISRGLGHSSDTPLPAFRLFNTPEITLIRLTSSL